MNFDASNVSLLVLFRSVICIEFSQCYANTVLLGLVCPCQLRDLSQNLCFLKLVFGHLGSLSCFIVGLSGTSAAHKERQEASSS